MAQFDALLINHGFAIGSTRYYDRSPHENKTCIVLMVTLEGKITTDMIVDTGAPWCVLAPELAEEEFHLYSP